MRKILLFMLAFIVFSCSKDNEIHIEETSDFKVVNYDSLKEVTKKNLEERLSVMQTTNSTEYTDWSGKIQLKIFEVTVGPAAHPSGIASVSSDYVLVGGGAKTTGNANGAYLTESRPNLSLTSWHAKSKDHYYSNSHTLTIYAIGMKIEGISSDYLRSKMGVFTSLSGNANHPSTYATVPSGYLLIGGGAEVHYYGNGNLIVNSYPSGNSWHVKSKDHIHEDKSEIKAYAIGIQDIYYPRFGHLEMHSVARNTTWVTTGVGDASTTIPAGWAVTCSGGKATFSGAGRMMMEIYPTSGTNSATTSKDTRHASSGTTYAYVVRIQKRQ